LGGGSILKRRGVKHERELEYEIYTFGEQTMIVPVKKVAARGEVEVLERYVKKLLPDADVEIRDGVLIVKVPRHSPRVTARRIKKVRKLAEKHGMEVRFIPV
jgi:ATPase